MASIKGITLKSIKEFQDREGDGAQGNVYMDGKKIGWYNNPANGGCCDIDIFDKENQKIFNSRVESLFAEYPHEFEDEEIFFCILLMLFDLEKAYKKALKKGFSLIVTESVLHENNDAVEGAYFRVRYDGDLKDKDAICQKYGEDFKNPVAFTSLDDFNI